MFAIIDIQTIHHDGKYNTKIQFIKHLDSSASLDKLKQESWINNKKYDWDKIYRWNMDGFYLLDLSHIARCTTKMDVMNLDDMQKLTAIHPVMIAVNIMGRDSNALDKRLKTKYEYYSSVSRQSSSQWIEYFLDLHKVDTGGKLTYQKSAQVIKQFEPYIQRMFETTPIHSNAETRYHYFLSYNNNSNKSKCDYFDSRYDIIFRKHYGSVLSSKKYYFIPQEFGEFGNRLIWGTRGAKQISNLLNQFRKGLPIDICNEIGYYCAGEFKNNIDCLLKEFKQYFQEDDSF